MFSDYFPAGTNYCTLNAFQLQLSLAESLDCLQTNQFAQLSIMDSYGDGVRVFACRIVLVATREKMYWNWPVQSGNYKKRQEHREVTHRCFHLVHVYTTFL